jgi:hypothetical protein
MASGFIDSLKLVLSDKYDISDSDYKTLSDILISKGLSDGAFDSGLVQMIYLMIKYNHKFPISITFLKELWEYENISYNFVSMIGSLLKSSVISLRKIKRENFFTNDSITKSNTEDRDKDIYVVIYGTASFNEVFAKFKEVLNDNNSPIQEGVLNLPKKYQSIIDRAYKMLKNLGVSISLESFVSDSALGTSRINVILSQTSKYKYKDRDIQRIASKHIKGKAVKSVESYKESDDELFLGVDVYSSESDFRSISDGIYSFVEELEVEGV